VTGTAWARAVAFHIAERPDLEEFDGFVAAFPRVCSTSGSSPATTARPPLPAGRPGRAGWSRTCSPSPGRPA